MEAKCDRCCGSPSRCEPHSRTPNPREFRARAGRPISDDQEMHAVPLWRAARGTVSSSQPIPFSLPCASPSPVIYRTRSPSAAPAMTGAGGSSRQHLPADQADWSASFDGAATCPNATALSTSVDSQIESRFHLPPHQLASDGALYEGDAPNVLADNVLLHPHTAHLASTDPTGRTSARPGLGSRTSSWHSALWATEDEQDERGRKRSDSKRRKARGDRGSGPAASPSPEAEAGHGAAEDEEEDHRDDYARSKSQRRKMPWYRRPSPIWFFVSRAAPLQRLVGAEYRHRGSPALWSSPSRWA